MPSRPALIAASTLVLAGLPGLALAQDSVADGSTASGLASGAAGALAASGVKTAVGVAALPVSLAATGSVVAGESVATAGVSGMAVGGAGLRSARDSAAFASRPLPVSPEVVVSPGPAPHGPPQVPYAAQPN